ncbi:alpha/beta hydrolase [Pseudalgibacter alginicilyticus]|uniref:Alpha/beta hydrolase n=1 Tax=Pseudalgibacter alginicilyticus TaxID=1736674 RepID=A0A0P0DB42_9FLAO|nr:alpha/beta hydrolase [Pseudalgibacter alginicilyticus]ALJ05295.1 alpha/beta hydrolase [Pseudalgibacter alginicilyticus]
MKIMTTIKTVFLFCLFMPFILIAQNKTGNIVEYFGKEKVDDINEGKLLHVFTSGLALKIQNFHFESSSFPEDKVFRKFLMESDYLPSNNQVFDIDFQGNEQKWKAITTDSTNSFNDRSLRSSYVFLSYKSPIEQTVLFEASGHSLALINGLPHEGDHYDFGWNLIPLKLKKGMNTFVLKVGRFPRIRARLIEPQKKVQITTRDLTIPDILVEEQKNYIAAVRVINTTENWIKNYQLISEINGQVTKSKIQDIAPLSVQKVAYKIASVTDTTKLGKIEMTLNLSDGNQVVDTKTTTNIRINSKYKKHKRTFISDIDGSVQYFSVAPATNKQQDSLALFLSVHGASVKAENQANAYKQKDWGNVIAPTNRRPFGFAWEDWGRLDALEVLNEAKRIYEPDPKRIYLTGHSMGGHGTWYLGATYPDHFAAIAPCAGYPDLLLYRDASLTRRLQMSQEQLSRFGLTPKVVARLKAKPLPTAVESLIYRAGTPSRTLKLIRNYLHFGVYVLHGEEDSVVPTYIARDMRERLGKFHSDFTYYEYPGGTHWYGNHSIDWEPIFDFFKDRTIKDVNEIKTFEFFTGSPGVSATSHFITIHQQIVPFETSSFDFSKEENKYILKTENTALIEVDLSVLKDIKNTIEVDEEVFEIKSNKTIFLKKTESKWQLTTTPSLKEKGPHRNGGFKDAFNNDVVFVYATKGLPSENEWYYNRARFDAETFWYRANGSIEIVKDVDFSLNKYKDRNVVVYGNKDNNSAWKMLLKDSPIQVQDNKVDFNGKVLAGTEWGMYFIVPRSDSNKASVGVVTATGQTGFKAAYMNHYLVNGTTFPDVLLFNDTVLENGIPAVKCAGFFGNDWSIETGDFEWN